MAGAESGIRPCERQATTRSLDPQRIHEEEALPPRLAPRANQAPTRHQGPSSHVVDLRYPLTSYRDVTCPLSFIVNYFDNSRYFFRPVNFLIIFRNFSFITGSKFRHPSIFICAHLSHGLTGTLDIITSHCVYLATTKGPKVFGGL